MDSARTWLANQDHEDDAVVVAPTEVDAVTGPVLAERIAGALALGPRRVVVDFSGTTSCDSTAVRVLLEAAAVLQQAGCVLQVREPGRHLRLLATALDVCEALDVPPLPCRSVLGGARWPRGQPEVPVQAHEDGGLAALRVLLRTTHLAGPDDLPALVQAAGAELGAVRAVLYLVDYDQVQLVPLVEAGPGGEHPEPVPIEGTLAGRSFSDVTQHTTTAASGPSLWTPLVDGTDRLGVLHLQFDAECTVDDDLMCIGADVAALLADLVATRAPYCDGVERARRRVPMTVPAELQWALLPPLTFVSPHVAVAGVLAPTHEVAGDSFDYALNDDVLHVAIVDGMGHGLESALLAAVAVAALRNARRAGLTLPDTVQATDVELSAHFGPDRFVTGIVGELDVVTGWWRWATCGHPPALLVRGGRVVKELDAVIGVPLGLGMLADGVEVGAERLQPGDRLLLYTDGVVEARNADGVFFGVERLVELVIRQDAARRPVAETLRRLNHAILAHQEGALQDDATTVLVEWLTDQPDRSTPQPTEAPPA